MTHRQHRGENQIIWSGKKHKYQKEFPALQVSFPTIYRADVKQGEDHMHEYCANGKCDHRPRRIWTQTIRRAILHREDTFLGVPPNWFSLMENHPSTCRPGYINFSQYRREYTLMIAGFSSLRHGYLNGSITKSSNSQLFAFSIASTSVTL